MAQDFNQRFRETGSHTPNLLLGLYAVWATLIGCSLLQDFAAPDAVHIWLLDVDFEGSIYTWFSQLVLAGVAFALFDIAANLRNPSKTVRLHWLLLAGGFVLLSMDEMLGLHEKIGMATKQAVDPTEEAYFPWWVIPAIASCTVVFLASIPFLKSLPRSIMIAFLACGGIFLTGAVGFELLGAHLAEGIDKQALLRSAAYRLEVNFEEALEGLGALLFLATLLRNRGVLTQNRPGVTRRASREDAREQGLTGPAATT